jgi:hypothetical protein
MSLAQLEDKHSNRVDIRFHRWENGIVESESVVHDGSLFILVPENGSL